MAFSILSEDITTDQHQLDTKRIKITAYTAVICIFLCVLFGAVFFTFNIFPLNFIFAFFAVVHFSTWRICVAGFSRVAKIVLYFSLLLQVVTMSVSLGSEIDLKVFYIPIAIIPFIIFGKNERPLFNLSILFTLLNIALIYSLDKYDISLPAPNISANINSWINTAFNLTAIFCMIFLANLFLSLSELGETLLLEKSNQLKEKQQQLSEQNQELEKTKSELERLNSVKDRLLSILSHDLKSPINNIQAITELILEEKIQIEEIKAVALKFKESSIHTKQLLDNLVNWSSTHLTSHEPHPRRICMKELIDNVFHYTDYLAKNKSIKLINSIEPDTFAWCDYDMMDITFRNIILNAIKFSHPRGEVAAYATVNNKHIRITIEDHGIGIPHTMLNQLFEPNISKTRLGTNAEKGSGIGLLLCKQLINANDGQIYVYSTPGIITTFSVELPVCED
jgi:two-component system sensor histidine kinase/response regulator